MVLLLTLAVLGKLASLFLGLSAGSVSVESLELLHNGLSFKQPAIQYVFDKIWFLHDNIQFLIDTEQQNEQMSD